MHTKVKNFFSNDFDMERTCDFWDMYISKYHRKSNMNWGKKDEGNKTEIRQANILNEVLH